MNWDCDMASERLIPIREVARITGVNPVTLRAWQRRHGLIKPQRTDKGHRLYSAADIDLIREILYWLEQGVSIGKVKSLLAAPKKTDSRPTDTSWDQARGDLLDLATSLSLDKLDRQLRELSKVYPAPLFLQRIVEPWLADLASLDRPDREILQRCAEAILMQFVHQVLTLKTGPRVAVAAMGKTPAYAIGLARYELLGMAIQSIDIGQLAPDQLSLARERLHVDAYILVLGGGLRGPWFSRYQPSWPENIFYVGPLGRLYQSETWLHRPYAEHVSQLEKFPPWET